MNAYTELQYDQKRTESWNNLSIQQCYDAGFAFAAQGYVAEPWSNWNSEQRAAYDRGYAAYKNQEEAV